MIGTLKSQLTSYQDAANSAILDLKASSTKLTCDEKTSELEKLRQENQKLKDENNALTERVNNLAHTLSDLNNKAKIAKDEKASLICSLRILQDDINHQAEQWSINKNSRSGKKKDGARSTKTSAHDEYSFWSE